MLNKGNTGNEIGETPHVFGNLLLEFLYAACGMKM
jgi:hypothetical protein